MKRILFAVLTVLGLSVSLRAQAPCTFSNVDPAQGPLQALIDDAGTLSGSVICLAAGSVTYTVQVDPSAGGMKCLEIRGHGTMPSQGSAGETIIYVDETSGGAVFYGYENATQSCTISNIRFLYDENSASNTFSILGVSHGAGDGKPWIFHHNDFFITGQCERPIIIDAASPRGLIYRNVFTSQAMGTAGGCNYSSTNIIPVRHEAPGNDAAWAAPSTFGSLDTGGLSNLYVETNYFKNFAVAADLTSSSRGVWRFNEMHNSATGGHGYDTNAQGDRQEEQYNNTYICDDVYGVHSWLAQRGATWRIFNNTYAAFDPTKCAITSSSANSPIFFLQGKLEQCDAGNQSGWPGSYPGTYPVSHQVGWGYNTGATNVGSSTAQGQPGGAGFNQDLDPIYVFANTNNSGNPLFYVETGNIGTCRAMAYSNTGKGGGAATTLVIPSGSSQANPYWNVGQEAVVVFSDLVGGSTPTIADSLGNTWSALTGGTNGSLRLTAWHSHITNAGAPTVTITFGSSSAARAGTLVVMRGMTASPLDQNPAVNTSANASPYLGPTVGGVGGAALAQTNEIVLGYYALNAPADKSGTSVVNDAIDATSPTPTTDERSVSCSACTGFTGLGIAGTLGSTDTTNAVVAVTYRPVAATTAVQPSLDDATANRNGIAGTISFKVSGSDSHSLDLQNTDFIQSDREYFNQASGIQTNATTPFNGTTGTGWGTRANRPTTCTYNSSTGVGVAYWSTDQGSWNMSGSGGQGVLDMCTATNTWTNAVYVPYDYPNPLATVTGGSCTPDHLTYTDQPASALAGASLGTTAVGVYDSGNNLCTDATNTITLSKNGSATYGTLSSSSSLAKAASSGVATWTDLSINTAGSGTIDAAASGLTGTTSNSITISASCSPDHLAWIGQPSDAIVGATLGTLSVQVQDVSNNPCMDDNSTSITLSKDGSATWNALVSGSSLTKTVTSGLATWTDTSVTPTTGSGKIQAAASGLAGAGSVDITISDPVIGTGGGIGARLKLNIR